MAGFRVLLAAVAGLLMLGAPAHMAAQLRHELGLQASGNTGRPAAVVIGPVWAWQAGVRDRLVLHAGVGGSEHQLAFRGEALWQFRFEPSARTGVGLYVGGGLAGQTAASTHGWIVATLGMESRPAAAQGWTVEAGIGGGLRLVLGYRWRKSQPWKRHSAAPHVRDRRSRVISELRD